MYNDVSVKKIEEKLEMEKLAVEKEIAKLTGPEEPMDNPSPEDLASDATEDIIEESILKVHRDMLIRIEDAQARVRDGTFGRCIECGKEIGEAVLTAEPWLEFCENCNKRKVQ